MQPRKSQELLSGSILFCCCCSGGGGSGGGGLVLFFPGTKAFFSGILEYTVDQLAYPATWSEHYWILQLSIG